MSDTFHTITPARRNEQHRCECGARFEVGHHGDIHETTVTTEVPCPKCGAKRVVSVPRGTERDLTIELVPGPEPETGGGGGGD